VQAARARTTTTAAFAPEIACQRVTVYGLARPWAPARGRRACPAAPQTTRGTHQASLSVQKSSAWRPAEMGASPRSIGSTCELLPSRCLPPATRSRQMRARAKGAHLTAYSARARNHARAAMGALRILVCCLLLDAALGVWSNSANASVISGPIYTRRLSAVDSSNCRMAEYQALMDSASVLGYSGWVDPNACPCDYDSLWTRVHCCPSSGGGLDTVCSIGLSGPEWSGRLPGSWSALTGLQSIIIQVTRISGELPVEWSTLSNLWQLRMYSNKVRVRVISDTGQQGYQATHPFAPVPA
jgi:hypothetical protein